MYYLIEVFIEQENRTIKLIRDRISPDSFVDCFYPKKELIKKYKGELHTELVPFFPGYIFVDTNNPKQFLFELSKIGSFTKLLGKDKNSGEIIPISEKEMEIIDEMMGKGKRVATVSDVCISEGKEVIVLSGPLKGNEGIIKKVNLHKRIAYIELKFGDNVINAELGLNIIKEKTDEK